MNSKLHISGILVSAYIRAMKQRLPRRSRLGTAAAAIENETKEL